MSADATLVVVNWRSASLAAAAVASARAAFSGVLRVVIVDNSPEAGERARLEQARPDVLIEAPENPGYGGGANLGAQHAAGEALIVANADVEPAPGSLDRLIAELGAGRVALAGPRFVWDAGGAWMLPPAEVPTRRGELARVAAGRSPRFARLWRGWRRRARLAFWERAEASDVEAISGALLVIRREAFESIGGFDPSYRLYFEEIDLMTRLRRAGWRVRHVPEARCRHRYNQSAGESGMAGALYAESERRYLERWCGAWFAARVLQGRRPIDPGVEYERGDPGKEIEVPEGEWLVEASPLADFTTAAGSKIKGRGVRIPEEILGDLRSGSLFVRVTELGTAELVRAVEIRKRIK